MTNHQWKECQRSFHCEFCSRILPNFKIASNGSDIALPWPAGRAILQGQADSQLEILQLTLANPLLLLPPFTRGIQHELISTSFTRDVSMHMPVESHKEKKKKEKIGGWAMDRGWRNLSSILKQSIMAMAKIIPTVTFGGLVNRQMWLIQVNRAKLQPPCNCV